MKWHAVFKYIPILMVLWCTSCSNYQKTLSDKMPDKDMAELTLKLYQEGIISHVTRNSDGTFLVTVPANKYRVSNEILLKLGLYHSDNQDKFLKLATKSSMVETPMEQQFKFNQIVAQELSSTLSNLHNVVYAEVYISSDLSGQTDNVDFSDDTNNASNGLKASVLLKVNLLSNNSTEALINSAKKIVAGAVKGLTTDDVYVVIENS